jgi:hypothetical protein
MSPLSSELRRLLEASVLEARDEAERAAKVALKNLAIEEEKAFAAMSDEQRRLRNALRARARQLGGGNLADGMPLLVEEVAYVQWHRMLFARFLAENHLLMHPAGVPVTLDECAELAPEEGEPDAWQLAARYAGLMLPGIFRPTDPAARLRFAPEGRTALERHVVELPAPVFTADDSLGWVYQFWQTKRKKAVNDSGRKIGGADISPVTQLFTEHYMVQFLLENSLGAWWAARHPDSPLVKTFTYLRYTTAPRHSEPERSAGEESRPSGGYADSLPQAGAADEMRRPAAGSFPGWPQRAAEVTMVDPCCGSGHFLVAAFEMLRRMRMEEEGLSEAAAAEATLRDNIHGLELDARCTQLAAFALAFAAWKAGGYRTLPALNIACSGIPVQGQLADWTALAAGDDRLRAALERLYHLFKHAPDLGSLINPADLPLRDRMFTADYAEVEPLLEQALSREKRDPAAEVFGAAAEGVAKAARLLARKYTLVATNVPYLLRRKHNDFLREYLHTYHRDTESDIATAFLDRCRGLTLTGCSYCVVTPQNWLFLGSYKNMRLRLLREQAFVFVVRLGHGAFETISGEVVNTILFIASNYYPDNDHGTIHMDLSMKNDKNDYLPSADINIHTQKQFLDNPDSRVVSIDDTSGSMLSVYADSMAGTHTGDGSRLIRCYWELDIVTPKWVFFQSSISKNILYGGRDLLLQWNSGKGAIRDTPGARISQGAWGKSGVAVRLMGNLPVTLYSGDAHDDNIAVIVPKDMQHLSAIWAFCQSPEFNTAVRQIDTALKVTNATLVKVPFDLARWQKVAEEAGPLPEPHSSDPTQWLFNGRPAGSDAPLQVAVARLLGYRWPQQEYDGLDLLADADGIACLPAVARELPAEERLRALLAKAYGADWNGAMQAQLLAGVGARDLGAWLRDDCFKQHCSMFHNRPFIWHIWDGRKDGFAALVNYHRLDAARLDKLIYTYLGSWIETQRAAVKRGEAGADGRLVAALELQKKLEAIKVGEPPYDIYVRWKSLAEQPIGWNPDLNDGVRLNIRPFVKAEVLRARFTINWNKDRGTNPDGSERLNDLHFSNEAKLKARDS